MIKGLAALVLLAAVGVAVALGVERSGISAELEGARAEIAELRAAFDEATSERERLAAALESAESARQGSDVRRAALDGTIELVSAPATRVVDLETPGDGVASGRAFLSPAGGRLLLFTRGLEPLPPEKTYQAWIETRDETAPAGLFRGHEGRLRHEVVGLPIGGENALAAERPPARIFVTVEASRGSLGPTGARVLEGRASE